MTRSEARRAGRPDVSGPEDGGPDPTEDPILYLQDLKEDEE
jgi:hypothetical protein